LQDGGTSLAHFPGRDRIHRRSFHSQVVIS
jgi:hypothetical protein